MSETSLIVIGKVATDIVVSGFATVPKSGHGTKAKTITFDPGGKARNIASLAAVLMPKHQVAIIAKTAKDPYGLWRIPLDALTESGINTSFVTIAKDASPSLTVVLVDRQGANRLIGALGAADTLGRDEINNAAELFAKANKDKGIVVITGNCPLDAIALATELSSSNNLGVVFDPGGAENWHDMTTVLNSSIYLFKPNEHEARAMSGVTVKDLTSAQKAAKNFLEKGVQNVLITAGADGAYLFAGKIQRHIKIPTVTPGKVRDSTGCGDQTLAALCAYLQDGKELLEATELALIAGTLQFYRAGVRPVTREEIESQL